MKGKILGIYYDDSFYCVPCSFDAIHPEDSAGPVVYAKSKVMFRCASCHNFFGSITERETWYQYVYFEKVVHGPQKYESVVLRKDNRFIYYTFLNKHGFEFYHDSDRHDFKTGPIKDLVLFWPRKGKEAPKIKQSK